MKASPCLLRRLLATACSVALFLHAAAAESACCKPKKPPADLPACCPALPVGELTRDSVYQLDVNLRTDAGPAFELTSLRGKPVLIAMFFASCTYACPMLLADLTQIRASLPPDIRADVAIVLISFDPKRDTPDALRHFRQSRQLDNQWILLSPNDNSVSELAAVLGVKYTPQADGQFAHSNLVTVLNGEGEIVHQRIGLTGAHDRVVEAVAKAVADTRRGAPSVGPNLTQG